MYDISAKASSPTAYWQMASLMLQTLLEERLKLSVHTEARDTSVYIMTVARQDSRLKRSSCTPVDWDHPFPEPGAGVEPPPQKTIQELMSGEVQCKGGRFRPDGPNIIMDLRGIGMDSFAATTLSGRLGRPVIDKTGLTGLFDIHLEYSQHFAAEGALGRDVPTTPDVPPKPDLMSALQAQLGLKLTSGVAPLDVIIIDHVERPSEN
jgi:uncharacterized protein (TIGR03435 family)